MVIGITGGIACGKSLVTSYLLNKKYNIIDCDEISHYVLTIDFIKKELRKIFGDEIFINDEVDRKKLGKIIFNDSKKNEYLRAIVFSQIFTIINKKISESKGIVFLDAPLLFEYNIEFLADKIIVVKTTKEEQIKRLMNRDNIDREYAIKKINSQMPIEEKIKKANYIIDNSNSVEDTYVQIKQILEILEEEK